MGDVRYQMAELSNKGSEAEKDGLLSDHKDNHHVDPGHHKRKRSLHDLQDKDLEVVVKPGDPLTSKEAEANAEKPPKDRCFIVYIIFLIHGIAVLMPWNMFITANDYFIKHKLASSSANSTEGSSEEDPNQIYRDYFLSSVCFVAQVPNILLNGFNLFFQVGGGGSVSKRITWSIIVIVVVFICTVVLAMVDSSAWPAAFFWITMVSVVIINSANGMYQNSVYGLAACLPAKYTNAVVLGSNTSGAITAVIALLSIWLAPDLRISAIYYFITAVFVLLVAFDSFFALPLIPFYKYYAKKAQLEKMKANEQREAGGTGSYLKVYLDVFKITWKHDFSVMFVFFVTLTCFPAIQAGVGRINCDFIGEKYFTAVTCFLFFNFFAMSGSIVTIFVQWPGPRWSWLIIVLRALFIPFLVLCNFRPETRTLPVLFNNDYVYCAGGILMALTSGYFSSLSMMFAPQDVEDKHKGVAGMMAAFSLITGIFFGVVFSFPVIAFVENIGSSPAREYVCDSAAVLGMTSGNFTGNPAANFSHLGL